MGFRNNKEIVGVDAKRSSRVQHKATFPKRRGGDASFDNQDETRHDGLCYAGVCGVGRRCQRKEINISRDGGAASVPSPRAALSGGARR